MKKNTESLYYKIEKKIRSQNLLILPKNVFFFFIRIHMNSTFSVGLLLPAATV